MQAVEDLADYEQMNKSLISRFITVCYLIVRWFIIIKGPTICTAYSVEWRYLVMNGFYKKQLQICKYEQLKGNDSTKPDG